MSDQNSLLIFSYADLGQLFVRDTSPLYLLRGREIRGSGQKFENAFGVLYVVAKFL